MVKIEQIDDVMKGYYIIGAISLILGLIVYKITTSIQASKNKRYVAELAKKLF